MSDCIKKVKEMHQDELMSMKDVVSVGIGLSANGKPCIVVGVREYTSDIEASVQKVLGNYPLLLKVSGVIRPF